MWVLNTVQGRLNAGVWSSDFWTETPKALLPHLKKGIANNYMLNKGLGGGVSRGESDFTAALFKSGMLHKREEGRLK